METSNSILDVVLLLIIIAVIDYIEISQILKLALLACALIYAIIKIAYAIAKLYYLIKNKGKE